MAGSFGEFRRLTRRRLVNGGFFPLIFVHPELALSGLRWSAGNRSSKDGIIVNVGTSIAVKMCVKVNRELPWRGNRLELDDHVGHLLQFSISDLRVTW